VCEDSRYSQEEGRVEIVGRGGGRGGLLLRKVGGAYEVGVVGCTSVDGGWKERWCRYTYVC
jgi:hypothetical protein